MILHFRQVAHLQAKSSVIVERRCVEHPRLLHVMQRHPGDAGELEEANDFRISLSSGHAVCLPSLKSALDYLRINPLPGDIVAVPSWETTEC
jgi:hypothetical protein